MSKSLGNVVAPHEIIEKLGTDGLRLWVASIDLNDAVVSEVVFENVKEVLRKIRVTCRFMLSNLYGFKEADLVPFADLLPLDKYAISRLIELNDKVIQAYNEIKYTTVFHQIAAYCAEDLSAVYLDVIKDRLYVEAADSNERRSAQTVCWYVLDTLVRLIAPILSFTAEHLSDYYQKDKQQSIHLQNFANLDNLKAELAAHVKAVGGPETFENIYKLIFKVRDGLLKSIEEQRAKGLIKHPLEAHVQVDFAPEIQNQLASIGDLAKLLKELLVVSKLEIVSKILSPSDLSGMTVLVQVAVGNKCPRCWHYHESSNHDNLCARCKLILV